MKRSLLFLAAILSMVSLIAIPFAPVPADAAKVIKLHNLNKDDPFAFPNINATYVVFDGPFDAKLAEDIEKKTGMKVLGFGDSGGFFHFTNSKRPIQTPDDMKGLKIRTMGLDTHKAIVSALGGQPSVIPWAEVYTACKRVSQTAR